MRFSNRLMASVLGDHPALWDIRRPQAPTGRPSVEELYGDRDLTDVALRELALDIAIKIPGPHVELANARDLAAWLLDPEAHRAVRRSALERAHRRYPHPHDGVKGLIRHAEEYEQYLGERDEWSLRA